MTTDSSDQATDDQRFKRWEKYEEVAMHFNDLILRLRVQALGGITAVVALSGIAVNFAARPATSEQWDVIFGTLVFLIAGWSAIAILDLCYYHTLLLGAVDALLEIEESSDIILSSRIEQRFRRQRPRTEADYKEWKRWRSERIWPLWFYGIGLSALLVAAVCTKLVALSLVVAVPDATLKVNVDRVPGEKLQLTVDPTNAPASHGSSKK
jgi:hypothetical protein